MKRTTQKELFKECKEILTPENPTEKEKAAAVKHEVAGYVEDLIEYDSMLPEMVAWRKREAALERKYYPKRGVTICCPNCGDFYPKRPPEVRSNDAEFSAIRARKVDELLRKILGREAA
jgi:hypothetical protein